MLKTILLCGALSGTLLCSHQAMAETEAGTGTEAEAENGTGTEAEAENGTGTEAEVETETSAETETVENEPSEANESPRGPNQDLTSESSTGNPPELTRVETPVLTQGERTNANDGRRPGFGLWIGGLVSGLVGFGVGIAGMALVFSEACAAESCPEWVVLTALGVAAFIAGIVMVTVGRRRMRRARALPEFMHSEARLRANLRWGGAGAIGEQF